MASACINNIAVSPERCPSSSSAASAYGWLSPRMSFSRDDDSSKKIPSPETVQDPAADFEFLLGEDPIAILPADELFSNGKLVPFLSTVVLKHSPPLPVKSPVGSVSPEKISHRRIMTEATMSAAGGDGYLFSPKAPWCSSRWRELLGFRKLNRNSTADPNPNPKSLKHFLHRTSRSNPTTSSSSLPLLIDAAVSDCESISIASSRLSLSSSSSGHDPHDELPRLSLDSELGPNPFLRNPNPPRIRMASRGPASRPGSDELHSLTADSPRMNSSGKVVFQSLERSSSGPSTFNGSRKGMRVKHRGMERSYSANVRVTQVLNVPVCSLRGSSKSFGFFSASSPQKRESAGSGSCKHINANRRNRKGSELTSTGS